MDSEQKELDHSTCFTCSLLSRKSTTISSDCSKLKFLHGWRSFPFDLSRRFLQVFSLMVAVLELKPVISVWGGKLKRAGKEKNDRATNALLVVCSLLPPGRMEKQQIRKYNSRFLRNQIILMWSNLCKKLLIFVSPNRSECNIEIYYMNNLILLIL